jgi:hypothetical protein
MKKIDSIVVDNFEDLKLEIFNNYKTLSNNVQMNTGPNRIRIFNLLNVDSKLPNFERFKKYLTDRYNVTELQIVIYSPFSGTGFHVDGAEYRYIIPIVSDEGALNLEMGMELANHLKIQDYSEKIVRPNTICETVDDIKYFKENLNNWFFSDSENNKLFIVPEGECWLIGKNPHSHSNISFNHRIIIVFDTIKSIE